MKDRKVSNLRPEKVTFNKELDKFLDKSIQTGKRSRKLKKVFGRLDFPTSQAIE